MWTAVKKFIAAIQNSEEEIRLFWLWMFGGLAAVGVIGLGLIFLNATTASVQPPPPSSSVRQVMPREAGVAEVIVTGVWQGVQRIWSGGQTVYNFVRKKVGTTHQVEIQIESGPVDNNFTVDRLEPIPPTPLTPLP